MAKKLWVDVGKGAEGPFSSPSPANRFERLLALFGAVAVCAVLLLLIFPRSHWPSTVGHVDEMDFYREKEVGGGGENPSYRVIKEYRITSTYNVDGQSYTITAIGQQNKGEGVFVGSTISVYYHPKDPSRASYSGNSGWMWRLILAGIIFLAVVATLIGFVQTTGSKIPSTFELTATAIINCPIEEVWAIIYEHDLLIGQSCEKEMAVVDGKTTWRLYITGDHEHGERTIGYVSIQGERQNEFLVREIQIPGGSKCLHSVRLVRDQSGCKVSLHCSGTAGNGFRANFIKVMYKYFGKDKPEKAARHYLESVASACPAEIQFLETAGKMYV